MLLILCVYFITGIDSSNVLAQNSAAKSLIDTTKTDVIEPIPLSSIGTATEKTLSIIREIRSKVSPSNAEMELDSLIPLKLAAVEKLKNETDLEEVAQMNLKQSENLKNDVSQLRIQLEDWRGRLSDKIEDNNKLKKELADQKLTWEKTRDLEREEKLPQQVAERLETNLKEIDLLNKKLVALSNDLLTRVDQLTGALIYLDEVLNVVQKTEETLRSNIFSLGSPPVWQMFSVEADTLSRIQRAQNIINVHNSDFRRFFQIYRVNTYIHLVIFAVLLFFSYALKKEVSRWSDEKKDEAITYSLMVIKKPIWASLLVTLLLTGIIYKGAPGNVLDYYFALIVLPVLTIVPGLIPSIEKKYFYFVGGVFVLSQVQDYFADLVILDRLLMLLIDVTTVLLLISLLRQGEKIRKAEPRVMWGFTFTVMRLCALLLVVSIISNTVGNTVLAKLLSDGCLPMIYGGVVIYSSALILKGLFALLIQHESLAQLNMIQNYADDVKKHIFRAIRFFAVIYWLYITLSGFEIYDPIYAWFEELFMQERVIGSVSFSIGSILAFFITLWLSLTLSKLIRFILQDEILTHVEMPRGVPGAISMLVRLVLITIGFILAFGAAGIDLSNITIIVGALGVGIGFGLQNIFNNLISGLILAFERPIQVGDIIQIASLNLMGEVKDIGIRASIVRTFDGAEVVVPNGNLISNEMINWTLSDHRRRQEILVGVAYGTDTSKVLEILNEVVPAQEHVLKNPAPFIIFLGFGDSSLDFRVLFWTHFDNGLGTRSAVGIAIDEAFKKNGIEIPFPQRDLHLRSVSDQVDFAKQNKTAGQATQRRKTTKAPTNGKNK